MPQASLPEQGSAENLFARLEAYLEPFCPGWRSSLDGVSDATLDEYCELAKLDGAHTLPITYRVWVHEAGYSDGGLVSKTLRVESSVPELIEFYRESHEYEPEFIEPTLPIVLNRMIGDEISFDLTLPNPNPQLRETGSGEIIAHHAASWESLLFQCAARTRDARRFPSLAIYSASENTTKSALAGRSLDSVIEPALRHLGLELGWFNDDRHIYGFGASASLFIDIGQTGAAPITVAASNPSTAKTVGDTLAQLVGARPAARERWR